MCKTNRLKKSFYLCQNINISHVYLTHMLLSVSLWPDWLILLNRQLNNDNKSLEFWRKKYTHEYTKKKYTLWIYTGKSASGVPERKNQGKREVLNMTKGLQGHNITCINFFTLYDLGQELLKKLTMLGTVKKNNPELPLALLGTKDRAPLSLKFAFLEKTRIVSYSPPKKQKYNCDIHSPQGCCCEQ